MLIANFGALSAGVCELAGMDTPPMKEQPNGLAGLDITLRGVPVSIHELPAAGVVLVAALSDPQPSDALGFWSWLMRGNAGMAGPQDPRFSRHPRTGRAMLHWAFSYADMSVTDAWHRLMWLVDTACTWRATSPQDTETDAWLALDALDALDRLRGTAATVTGLDSMRCFTSLYLDTCAALDCAPGNLRPIHGACAFQLNYRDRDISVLYVPLILPNRAIVSIPLRGAWSTRSTQAVTTLMDANFELLGQPDGAHFGVNPLGFELQYSVPLDAAAAMHLLVGVEQMCEFIRTWEDDCPDGVAASKHARQFA